MIAQGVKKEKKDKVAGLVDIQSSAPGLTVVKNVFSREAQLYLSGVNVVALGGRERSVKIGADDVGSRRKVEDKLDIVTKGLLPSVWGYDALCGNLSSLVWKFGPVALGKSETSSLYLELKTILPQSGGLQWRERSEKHALTGVLTGKKGMLVRSMDEAGSWVVDVETAGSASKIAPLDFVVFGEGADVGKPLAFSHVGPGDKRPKLVLNLVAV